MENIMNTQIIELKSEALTTIMKVAGGALAIAAASQVSIPMKPVPVTFQTLAIMIIGLTYTPKQAMSTMTIYMVAGAAGMPVFSNFNSGLPYMLGPTAGYLAGFFVAAVVMTYFHQSWGSGTMSTLCNCLLGISKLGKWHYEHSMQLLVRHSDYLCAGRSLAKSVYRF